jgi:low temperature requirement protein LtrA
VDYLAAGIGWPTPGLGRTRAESQIFTGVHVSERHRQIFIIGLGELILTGGLRFAAAGFALRNWITLAVTFAATVSLFLIYSYQARRLLAPKTLRSIDRVDRGILTAYSHLLLVAGVVLTSSAGGFIGRGPSTDLRTPEAIAIAAGPALFMLGSGLWEFAVTDRLLGTRLVPFALLIAVTPAIPFVPAVTVAIGANLVLAGTVAADAIIGRRRPWAGAQTSL